MLEKLHEYASKTKEIIQGRQNSKENRSFGHCVQIFLKKGKST